MPDFAILAALIAAMSAGLAAGWAAARRRAILATSALQTRLAEAEHLARTDSLTGLANRRAYDEQAALQTAVSRRYGTPLTLILFDVDGLKSANEREGHRAGDELLCRFARILQKTVRESDFVARWGGDEFVALLPQTDRQGGHMLVARLFARLADESAGLTVSAGIASALSEESGEELSTRADLALREAKRSGCGQIALHDGQTVAPVAVS